MGSAEKTSGTTTNRSGLLVVAMVLTIAAIALLLWYQEEQRPKGHDAGFAPTSVAQPMPSLDDARAAFHTRLLWQGPSPQRYEGELIAPADANEVVYESGLLKLRAWRSKDPGDGKRHPAVVYLHGNWVFEPRHWESTRPYRDAGFITLTPMLRGENGNAGSVEMFWGEVDDVVAAGNYLAALPCVDSNRVYLAGHSVGGTLVMLTAMVRSPYAAAASFSGSTNQRKFQTEIPEWQVFDRRDEAEFRLRSPDAFVHSLRIPLRLYAGAEEDWCISDLRQFAENARKLGKDCTFTTVPGDHGSMKAAAVPQSLEFFKQSIPAR